MTTEAITHAVFTAPDRIAVEVPGHTWTTGQTAPEIEGWKPCWVNHYGSERTVFVYRPNPKESS